MGESPAAPVPLVPPLLPPLALPEPLAPTDPLEPVEPLEPLEPPLPAAEGAPPPAPPAPAPSVKLPETLPGSVYGLVAPPGACGSNILSLNDGIVHCGMPCQHIVPSKKTSTGTQPQAPQHAVPITARWPQVTGVDAPLKPRSSHSDVSCATAQVTLWVVQFGTHVPFRSHSAWLRS